MSAGQLPPPGTTLRKYDRNGAVRCEAVVGENGQVIYRGVTYSSISAAAKVAAGDIGLAARSCDGYAFFGLKGRDGGSVPRAPRVPRPAGAAQSAPPISLPLPLPVRWDELPPATASSIGPTPLTSQIAPLPADVPLLSPRVEPAAKHQPLTDEIVAETVFNHGRHGRADANGAPIDSDCACRGTMREKTCAEAGCGFCRAAQATAHPTGSAPTTPAAATAAIAAQVRFPGDKTAVLNVAPDIDAPDIDAPLSVDLLQRGAVLVQVLDDLAGAQAGARQALNYAYDDLACSTNHKPDRETFRRLWAERKLPSKEFDAWAASRTWWDREPNDDRPLPDRCDEPIATAEAADAPLESVRSSTALEKIATQEPRQQPRIMCSCGAERFIDANACSGCGRVLDFASSNETPASAVSLPVCDMIVGHRAVLDYDKEGRVVGVEPGDEIECGMPAVKQVADDPGTRLCAGCALYWETDGLGKLEPIASPPAPNDYGEAASSGTHSASTQDGIAAETVPLAWPECTCRVETVAGDGQEELVTQRDPNCPLGASVGNHPVGGYSGKFLGGSLVAAPIEPEAEALAGKQAVDVGKMRADLLAEIDAVIMGTPFWRGGRLDTIKHLLACASRTETMVKAAARAALDAAARRAEARRAEAFDPDSDLIGDVIRALDVRDIVKAVVYIDQGPAPEGPPAAPTAPTSSSEGERRQDVGAEAFMTRIAAANAHSTLAEIRDTLLAAVDGDVAPNEQPIDTLKRIVFERDAAIAVAAAERAGRRGQFGMLAHIIQAASAMFDTKVDQGPALEGPPAASTSGSEGERRQDVGAAGTAQTADFLPLRQPESTGPAPAPDHSPTDVVVASSPENRHE